MLRNHTFAATANIFGKVVQEINERAAAEGWKNTITHSQVRNKFMKLVCECKSISLS